MLHDKFIIHVGLPVLEKKMFKGSYHIWAWRPSWSCDVMHDLDHLYKLNFVPFQGRLDIKFGFDWPSGFGGEDV